MVAFHTYRDHADMQTKWVCSACGMVISISDERLTDMTLADDQVAQVQLKTMIRDHVEWHTKPDLQIGDGRHG